MGNKIKFLIGISGLFAGMFFLNSPKAMAETCLSSSGVTGACYGTATGCPTGTASTASMSSCSGGGLCCVATASPTSTATTPAANTAASSASGTTFTNPLGFTTVSQLLSSVLSNMMGIIAIISIIFIVLGGLMYMMSAGNETMITRAKKTWTGAVIGLSIAIAAPTFLKTIQAILGGSGTTATSAESWVSSALSLHDIAVNVLNLLLSIFGIVAMISMLVGGIMYLTSGGDERKIDKGKDIFKYSLIGIIVALSALVIIHQVNVILTPGAA